MAYDYRLCRIQDLLSENIDLCDRAEAEDGLSIFGIRRLELNGEEIMYLLSAVHRAPEPWN